MILNSTKSHPFGFSIPYRFIFPHFFQGKELFTLEENQYFSSIASEGKISDHYSEFRTQSAGSLLKETPDRMWFQPHTDPGSLLEHYYRLELGRHGIPLRLIKTEQDGYCSCCVSDQESGTCRVVLPQPQYAGSWGGPGSPGPSWAGFSQVRLG